MGIIDDCVSVSVYVCIERLLVTNLTLAMIIDDDADVDNDDDNDDNNNNYVAAIASQRTTYTPTRWCTTRESRRNGRYDDLPLSVSLVCCAVVFIESSSLYSFVRSFL